MAGRVGFSRGREAPIAAYMLVLPLASSRNTNSIY